jgi:lysophospholipase L1-like esterase
MKCASIGLSKIAFVLFILGTILCQTLNNNSQQSGKFYSPDEIISKLEIKENQRAEYSSFQPRREDNARKLLITEGSSSTEGYGVSNEYPRQLAVLFGGNYYKQTVNLILDSNNTWTVRNVGNGGDTMVQVTAQYATQVLPFYNPSLSVNYLTLQGGSNDIANGRTTVALKNDVAAYVARAKADGFVVGVCTIFHRVGNDVGKVSDYNNWLRAGNSGADFIIDLAAHPFLSDASNTTYFLGDGVHTNNAGQSIIAGIFADAIPTIGAASVAVTVSGRVTDSAGEGIEGVTIKMTDSQGNARTTTTSSSGRYTFDDCQMGETYTLRASDYRYSFLHPWQILFINNVGSEVNFTALPITKSRKRSRFF